MSPTSDTSKVLAFFGNDLGRNTGESFLHNASRNGFCLLALDSPAAARACAAALDYTVAEDWIAPECIRVAVERATSAESQWFESAREEFTVNGVCWPDLDRFSMRQFWKDVMMAQDLAASFTDRGVKLLGVFQNFVPFPGFHESRSDVVSVMLKARFSGRTEVFRPSIKSSIGFWRDLAFYTVGRAPVIAKAVLWGRKALGAFTRPRNHCEPGTLDDKIVLVPDGELFRFLPIADGLSHTFPGQVAIVRHYYDKLFAIDSTDRRGIPVIDGPVLSGMGGGDIPKRFLRAYHEARESGKTREWGTVLDILRYHFDFYCRTRWPMANAYFQGWLEMWERAQPRAVITGALERCETLTVLEAAGRRGIPTFTIPHGGIQHGCCRSNSDWVLYSLPLQREVFAQAGIPADRLRECAGLLPQDEYPVVSAPRLWRGKSLRILALTDPTGLDYHLIRTVCLRAQMLAFRILANPPHDIANNLAIFLKTHPLFPDLEILSAADCGLEEVLVPANAGLGPLVEDCDLVVAVNYVGTAMVHVLRASKPVVYLNTEDEAMWRRTDKNCGLFLDGVTLVRTTEDFWSLVRQILREPSLLSKMSERARMFAQNYLEFSHLAPLSETLTLLTSQGMDSSTP